MRQSAFRIQAGPGPIVAAAVHNGHAMREEVAERYTLAEAERQREEDPYTGQWTAIADSQIVGLRSRFEVDLNRPPEKAVYLSPDDCWGLSCWQCRPPEDLIARSLEIHSNFYEAVEQLLRGLLGQHSRIVVYDLHSYNHLRDGPNGPEADPAGNPEVNIGTGTMDREYWGPVVDALIEALRSFDFGGRRLDVRENVKFQGGYFPRWIHNSFPRLVCAPAVEFKKFFMNEWTGEPDQAQLQLVQQALASTVMPVRLALEHIR